MGDTREVNQNRVTHPDPIGEALHKLYRELPTEDIHKDCGDSPYCDINVARPILQRLFDAGKKAGREECKSEHPAYITGEGW